MKIFLAAAFLILPVLSSWAVPPCEWEPGMYWSWTVTSPQSPNWTGTGSVYVLKAEQWGDYEVDFLAWIWPYLGGEAVRLGTAVRQPCGPMRGFGLLFSNALNWVWYPSGAKIEQYWSSEWTGEEMLHVSILASDAAVEVPAGKFEHCVHLELDRKYKDKHGIHSEHEEIWFSRELGWPVEGITHVEESEKWQFELLEIGQISVKEAVARVLAAVDKMPPLAAPPDYASRIRQQLLDLLP